MSFAHLDFSGSVIASYSKIRYLLCSGEFAVALWSKDMIMLE